MNTENDDACTWKNAANKKRSNDDDEMRNYHYVLLGETFCRESLVVNYRVVLLG